MFYNTNMVLEKYKEKREFNNSPEPAGRPEKVSLYRFVVQEHYASHHHFDFRLELPVDFFESENPSGPVVLKSWAIPKGISGERGVKRLAVQVEDHPVDYIIFEGTIPEGQYGAGTVSIWDKGTFEVVHKKPASLKLILHGRQLSGEFNLVRTKRGKGNDWLIFK